MVTPTACLYKIFPLYCLLKTVYQFASLHIYILKVCHLQAATAQSRQTVIETCEEGIKLLHFLLVLKTSYMT